ncbi:helicase-associated domain-containing protein [Streptacidiphilus sp. PB12-B1b]|uniref:helicase-associated domain-containing protein n=1 Tax=Streptacidiphilus sp. PB12-B1b TaxID=2705012 RepID=UPI0015F9F6EF|nr:helicase-associated domain-containing protein [Streptacidiphilus sp. PB12-B1b]QMU79355.1 helicase-associated domain-containing protein [Streptacidiphilus sp. PB12-B1b]
MKSATALRTRLARLDPGELAALLDARRIGGPALRSGRTPHTLAQLADLLLEDRCVAEAVSRLRTPGVQLLAAGVRLAAREHGPLRQTPYWTPLEPSSRPVDEGALLDFLSGGDAGLRAAAQEQLAALRELLLVLPAGPGRLALPSFVHRHLAETLGLGRPLAQLMSDAFNAPEVHRVAAALDLPGERDRNAAQAGIVALFSDRERVRALLVAAPPQAAEVLARLVSGPPVLRARCFAPLGGYHYGSGTKYQLRPEGSGDRGADWLAERGLLAPVGAEMVELPYEVADALTGGRVRAPFDPEPPRLRTGLSAVTGALSEAQAAVATAGRKVELLLASCAAVPPGVRKSGGLAVRDTRRLAKAIDAAEEQARLWIDLAYTADLLGTAQEEPERPAARGRGGRRAALPAAPVRLLPTTRYDDWLGCSPADRLVPVVCAWAVVPELFSWWPDPEGETPVALVAPQDQQAVPLRRQVLAALATLPPGQGVGPAAALGGEALRELLALVGWLCPGLTGAEQVDAGRLLATLHEAELLGAVAHGQLTPLGAAVLALLDTDAPDWFPYVPATDDSPPDPDPAADPDTAHRPDAPHGTDHPDTPRRPGAAATPDTAAASAHGPDRPDAPHGTAAAGAPHRAAAAGAYRGPVAALRAALAGLLPAPQRRARFQADLTAIAAGAPSAELAELLGMAAVRESEGHAVVWRFSAPSVRRALDAGLSAEELLRRLREAAEGGLPQPLEYLVRDTGRTHGHVRVVRSACCIRSDDEALLEELARTRSLAGLELRRIAPTVLISTAAPGVTLDALRAAGFAPVLEAETGVTVVERAPELRAEERMPDHARARREHGRSPERTLALAQRLLDAD